MTKETEQLIHLRSVIAERNLEIDKLNKELERVKGIARDRLDKIVNLQQDVAVLEDKLEDTRSELRFTRESLNIKIGELLAHTDRLEKELEDTRSELKYEKGISTQQRNLAGQLALELAQLEDDPRRLEDSDDDHGGLWGSHCRGEI